MCTLKETLKNFIEDKKHNAGMTLEELNEWFKKIAQVMLSGRFEITGTIQENGISCEKTVKVIPTTVEMYFHEERDRDTKEDDKYYKDCIVYHRNHDIKKINDSRKTNESEKTNEKQDIKYYTLGVLNTHQSGIDITFESKNYRFRASALIRAFRVEAAKPEGISEEQYQKDIIRVQEIKDVTGVQYINQKAVDIDNRSTYVYDALFSQFDIFDDGFSVKWVDGNTKDINSIITNKRKNVKKYDNITGKKITPEEDDERQWSFSVKEGQGQQQ